MKCQARFCENVKDVQFLIVLDNKKTPIKEYYCQKHLRIRAYQLELLKHSNKIVNEISGWK